MTKLIAYHKDTEDIALFESGDLIWAGQYDSFLTHQNSEPNYVIICSYPSIEYGIEKMNSLDPNLMY